MGFLGAINAVDYNGTTWIVVSLWAIEIIHYGDDIDMIINNKKLHMSQ